MSSRKYRMKQKARGPKAAGAAGRKWARVSWSRYSRAEAAPAAKPGSRTAWRQLTTPPTRRKTENRLRAATRAQLKVVLQAAPNTPRLGLATSRKLRANLS